MAILVVGILVLGISHTVQSLTREEVADNLAINVEDELSSAEYFALGNNTKRVMALSSGMPRLWHITK